MQQRVSCPGRFLIALVPLFCLLVLSCGQAQDAPLSATLDSQKPFGLSWLAYGEKGKQTGKHWVECRELVVRLDKLISPGRREYFLRKCAQAKYDTIFVPVGRLPLFFRDGALSVTVRGDSEPVAYEYHYQHRVLPDDDDSENQAQRNAHASIIRNEMNELYGPALATGHFDPRSEIGFTVDNREGAPCEIWLKENVGIILCTRRVVYVDGAEMSLSFIRLDRAPIGHSLRCMAAPRSSDNCDEDALRALRIDKDVVSLRKLADWLGPDDFRNCKLEDLEPIEEVWTLSQAEQAELASVLEMHTGDDLAQFAIDYAQNDEIPERKRTRTIMFLFRQAATQGSAIAMNEIGASLLYCYQHVRQDIAEARKWLEKAIAGGDPLAMRSLALMHLQGMTDAANPVEEAKRHLEQCAKLDAERCSDELAALNAITSAPDEEEVRP